MAYLGPTPVPTPTFPASYSSGSSGYKYPTTSSLPVSYAKPSYALQYFTQSPQQSITTATTQNKQVAQPIATPVPTPTPPSSGEITFDWLLQNYPGYAGWNPEAAIGDFRATGGAGKGGGGGGPSAYDLWMEQQRRDIESGYSNYYASLDKILNEYLPAQQTAQRQLAEEQYTSGVAQLQPQLQAGQTTLARQREQAQANQAKNLRDLAANLRNAFMSGNVYLGGLGAGDSSAAGMYSYALTKLGTQQRANVMGQTADILNQIGDREINLQNVYNAEVNRLESEKNQKISEIANWFATQQAALQEARGRGEISKAQDLANLSQNALNIALNQLQTAQQEAANRRAALDTWALNNSSNLQQVKQNLRGVGEYYPTLPQAGNVVGQPTFYTGGGFNVPATGYKGGYGGISEEERDRLLSGLFPDY